MGIGNRSWNDKNENYTDAYTLRISGTTATAIMGKDYKQPAVVYGLTFSCNPIVGSGDIVLVDGSATADSGDSRLFICTIATATNSTPFVQCVNFLKGLVFNSGIIVSATTVSGAINLEYKPRY